MDFNDTILKIKNNSQDTLSLSFKDINDEQIQNIFEALLVNTKVTEINIHNSQIEAKGYQCIATLLKAKQCSIMSLNLNNNNIGPEGAKNLAEALVYNTSIMNFYLSNNNIGPEGAKNFAEALKINPYIILLLTDNLIHNIKIECKINIDLSGLAMQRKPFYLDKSEKTKKYSIEDLFTPAKHTKKARDAFIKTLEYGQERSLSISIAKYASYAFLSEESGPIRELLYKHPTNILEEILLNDKLDYMNASIVNHIRTYFPTIVYAHKDQIKQKLGTVDTCFQEVIGLKEFINKSEINPYDENDISMISDQCDSQNETIKNNAVKELCNIVQYNYSGITKINLNNKSLGDEIAKELIKALKNNAYITDIDLSGNQISNDKIISINNELDINKSLNQLAIEGQPFYLNESEKTKKYSIEYLASTKCPKESLAEFVQQLDHAKKHSLSTTIAKYKSDMFADPYNDISTKLLQEFPKLILDEILQNYILSDHHIMIIKNIIKIIPTILQDYRDNISVQIDRWADLTATNALKQAISNALDAIALDKSNENDKIILYLDNDEDNHQNQDDCFHNDDLS